MLMVSIPPLKHTDFSVELEKMTHSISLTLTSTSRTDTTNRGLVFKKIQRTKVLNKKKQITYKIGA